MKKGRALILALLMLALSAAARAEDFDRYLAAAYPGWQVESQSAWAPAAAAVLKKEGQRALIVAEMVNGAWKTAACNPCLTREARWRCRVHLDTDEALFLTCTDAAQTDDAGAGLAFTLDFSRQAGRWRLTAVRESAWCAVGPEQTPVMVEHWAELADGVLHRSWYLCDENDNVLLRRALPDGPEMDAPDLAAVTIDPMPFDM